MSNWKNLLIPPEASIEDAIRAIGAGAMRIALVVDRDGKLLATVTDGDVRRGLIDQLPVTAPVQRIMNAAPKTIPVGTPREQAVALMHVHSVLQLPVVDKGMRVVGLETLLESGIKPRQDNWVFLMAGGFGMRLRPLTDALPKPMLPVGGKPVLETIVESFLAYGFHRFCIAVHYKAETIKAHFGDGARWNATIRYVEEETPLGTAGALSLLPESGELPVLVMNGDLLTRVSFSDLLRFHDEQRADATLCGRRYSHQVPFGVIDVDGQRVRRIVEKPVQHSFVSAGIYVIGANVIRAMRRGQSRDMPELIQELIERNRKVCFFPIHEYWVDIGQVEDFERAHHEFPGTTG